MLRRQKVFLLPMLEKLLLLLWFFVLKLLRLLSLETRDERAAAGVRNAQVKHRGMGVGCDDIHGVLDKYGDCKSLRSIIRINHDDW